MEKGAKNRWRRSLDAAMNAVEAQQAEEATKAARADAAPADGSALADAPSAEDLTEELAAVKLAHAKQVTRMSHRSSLINRRIEVDGISAFAGAAAPDGAKEGAQRC